jgi:hypothetical protein
LVSAIIDGRKQERLLQVGEKQTIDVRRELVLTAGDAGAIRMTINGEQARSLGRGDQVVTITVNQSNFKSFLAAR